MLHVIDPSSQLGKLARPYAEGVTETDASPTAHRRQNSARLLTSIGRDARLGDAGSHDLTLDVCTRRLMVLDEEGAMTLC